MKKTVIQGLILVASFLVAWFLLSQINWTELLKIDRANRYMEDKLPIMLSQVTNPRYSLDLTHLPVSMIGSLQ